MVGRRAESPRFLPRAGGRTGLAGGLRAGFTVGMCDMCGTCPFWEGVSVSVWRRGGFLVSGGSARDGHLPSASSRPYYRDGRVERRGCSVLRNLVDAYRIE